MSKMIKNKKNWLVISISCLLILVLFIFIFGRSTSYKVDADGNVIKKIPQLDVKEYDRRLNMLAHVATSTATSTLSSTTSATSTASTTKKSLWPVKTVYPNAGAILPFNRIVAYYGNLSSKSMGVWGNIQRMKC